MLSSKPYTDLHKHHIFPRTILERNGIAPDNPDEKEVFISGLGNITFISKSLHSEMPDEAPYEYLPKYSPLQKHFIPAEKELWKIEKYKEFKQGRIREIYEAAKRYFTEIIE